MSSQTERTRSRELTGRARDQMLAGLPVAAREVELAGVSTAVLEGGQGPPIVLLHGPGEFAALWARVIPDLVRTHRIVAPDLPGHGASSLPSGRLDRDRVLSWLGELIEETCPSPPVLVGHLLGGALAARFAGGRGDQVRALVLVDTFGLGWNRPALRFAFPLATFVAHPTERSRDRFLNQCFADFDVVRDDMGARFERLGDYVLTWARSEKAKPALRSLMPEFGLRGIPDAELAGITVPTTLIHGRHDLQTRLEVAERAAARYGWPLHVIEDCRDDPAFEQPAAFLQALHAALGSAADR